VNTDSREEDGFAGREETGAAEGAAEEKEEETFLSGENKKKAEHN
jgi:hypothetical protein